MKEFFEHIQMNLKRKIQLSREEWVNLILYWAHEYEKSIDKFSITLITNGIEGEILEYMEKNKIDILLFVDFYNEYVKLLRDDTDELRLQIQEELAYQLRSNTYDRKAEMIDLSRYITLEICKELKISHDEWARWVNEESYYYPLKITYQTFFSAVDFTAERIFQDLDMLGIYFLTFTDHEGKTKTISAIKDEIAMEVEVELANQLNPKYGKIQAI
jgi:hypothetical protein